MRDFVHLHVHTEYSLLDGSGKIEELVKKAKELGMKALAITDHGVMYGCVDFYKAAKEVGIKPIIGCEIYVAGKSMYIKQPDKENPTYHLVLLVKNEKGYQNLMQIVSAASLDGFYYKPRVDHEYLKAHSDGIIALSACLSGEVSANILYQNFSQAEKAALFYKETFKDGFYLELQNHGMEVQERVNKAIIDLSKKLNIPLVATNDVHYIEKEDSKAHDILLCIQTGKNINDENRMRYPSEDFYLKSIDEMYNEFSYVQEALENTVKIADECNYDYEFHKSKLPKYDLPEGTDPFEYLKSLCEKGLSERYNPITDEIKERLNYELSVIKTMGYVDYFLIVWDFIKFAKDNKIMTGPGRGSGAGSIVAYSLGITKIDPLKYGLIFERFLNPERVSMPDIDSDFCYERRQEVIDYVVRKYGKSNVSQIITFGTMAARMCIRDVGRAMDYTYAEVDKVAKMIPSVLNITIDRALEINPELKESYESDSRVHELIDIARKLEGLPRHTSTHAAGVVISSKPLVDFVPIQRNEESIVTQFPMTTLEELGLLKMDFLGLRTLTVMRDAVSIIKDTKGISIDLDKIGLDDPQVYKMIGDGKTVGVFQLEKEGMTNFMKELKPDSLEDIIAGISLYRPGPMAEIPKYLKNKKNPNGIEYSTPLLKPILDVTYGCMIYQEQVMQIVRSLAGYSMGRADLVRRAMSKKKHHVMEEERKNFIYGITDEDGTIKVPGCIRNGVSEEAANGLFDSMMDFASYAFNKSHAAAYAVIAYQTAYLMRYYPTEFIAAMLNNYMGDSDKAAFYFRYAKESGIKILPPDINESFSKFTVSDDGVRFGMAAIKNVGVQAALSIVKSRESRGKFKSLEDFIEKSDLGVINKRTVESLIKAGALDSFKVYRSKLLAVYEKAMDGMSSERGRNIEGQLNLFGSIKDNILAPYPDVKEFEKKYLLAMEKEMTGLYISGHPLDEYKDTLRKVTSVKISDLLIKKDTDGEVIDEYMNTQDGKKVIVAGIVTKVVKKVTKNNTMMAFLTLEDLYGEIEIIVFPRTYEKYKSYIMADELLIIKGKVSVKEEEQPKILCQDISKLQKIDSRKLYILVEENLIVEGTITEIKPLLLKHQGGTPIYICTRKERKKFRLDSSLWANVDDGLMQHLKDRFGNENVKIQ